MYAALDDFLEETRQKYATVRRYIWCCLFNGAIKGVTTCMFQVVPSSELICEIGSTCIRRLNSEKNRFAAHVQAG